MKSIIVLLSFLLCLQVSYAQNFWEYAEDGQAPPKEALILKPVKYQVLSLDKNKMFSFLFSIPEDAEHDATISLPGPDGSYRRFKIWQTPVMAAGLATRYPDIRTFTVVALDNRWVTGKLDITLKGFHAMIIDGGNQWFIDPYSAQDNGFYIGYDKKDYARKPEEVMACELTTDQQHSADEPTVGASNAAMKTHGTQFRKYRLALGCTGEYSRAVGGPSPTKATVLSAMVTSINRVNSIYERELAVTMELIANTDNLIYFDSTTDPYTNNNGNTMLGQNQTNVTNVIGSANYDIGHVFSTGGGGVATLASVCSSTNKARGVTGLPNPLGDAFDVDYVAHEIGHQFNGAHTFNASTGSCSGNGSSTAAYEPGSGITIMAYAGICQVINNLALHSIPYFHAKTLDQISTFITTGGGSTCPTTTTSPNSPSSISAFAAMYNVPILTPFELTAPIATDPTADTMTYSWEEWDLGDYGKSWPAVRQFGPIFRSFNPTTSPTRVFPIFDSLLLDSPVISYLGEKLPDTSRTLRFRLTVRDIYNGKGCFNFPDDTVTLNVINTPRGFTVTQPDTGFTRHWMGNKTDTVRWDVAGTDTSAVACVAVDIYLSTDSGRTYPILLKSATANNGMAIVTVPNIYAPKARVKVKGTGNVFFDIGNSNFAIDTDTTKPTFIKTNVWHKDVQVYPVPAKEKLTIDAGGYALHASIMNTVGQAVWTGNVSSRSTIDVSRWARGVYSVVLINSDSGERLVKQVALQ